MCVRPRYSGLNDLALVVMAFWLEGIILQYSGGPQHYKMLSF